MGAEKPRLFVAIEIPAGVRDGVDAAVEPLGRVAPAVRCVGPGAYHLTLAFLGWVDEVNARQEPASRIPDNRTGVR